MKPPRRPHPSASGLLTTLSAVVALALAIGLPSRATASPSLDLTDATGALSLSNSKADAAIFRGEQLRPDDQTSGTVTIANTGAAPATLAVETTGGTDTPGHGNRPISERLHLAIFDITDPHAPLTTYAGPLATMRRLTLGALTPGQPHTYLFVTSLPATATNDNDYQGASLSIGFTWSAQGAPTTTPTPAPPTPPAPTPAPDPSPTPVTDSPPTPVAPPVRAAPPTPDPNATVLPEQVISAPPTTRCLSRRQLTIRTHAPTGVAVNSTTVFVNDRRTKTEKGTSAHINLRGLPRGTYTIKVLATLTTGRQLVLKRTYHTCTARTNTTR